MGTDLTTILASIGAFWGTGFSKLMEYLSSVFMTSPGLIILLLGAAILGIIAAIAIRSERGRDSSTDLRALSEAMDEQSRLMEKMRRTLSDVAETLVSLEAATRYRSQADGSGANFDGPNLNTANLGSSSPLDMNVASALREELELLMAEISSDLSVEPSAD
jgi:hypothetical protein